MRLSKNIKYLRTAAGHTQNQLSQYLGVERSTISSYERGVRRPDIDKLQKLTKLYHVSIDSITHDNYEATGFSPPPCKYEFEKEITKDTLAETSLYAKDGGKIPKPTENQLRKKLNEIYKQLDYEEKLLLIQVGLHFLSGSEKEDEKL